MLENCEKESVEPTLDSNPHETKNAQTSKHKRFLSFFAEEEGAA